MTYVDSEAYVRIVSISVAMYRRFASVVVTPACVCHASHFSTSPGFVLLEEEEGRGMMRWTSPSVWVEEGGQ